MLHYSPVTGSPERCLALTQCRYQNIAEAKHFEDSQIEEARLYAEKMNSKGAGLFSKFGKKKKTKEPQGELPEESYNPKERLESIKLLDRQLSDTFERREVDDASYLMHVHKLTDSSNAEIKSLKEQIKTRKKLEEKVSRIKAKDKAHRNREDEAFRENNIFTHMALTAEAIVTHHDTELYEKRIKEMKVRELISLQKALPSLTNEANARLETIKEARRKARREARLVATQDKGENK